MSEVDMATRKLEQTFSAVLPIVHLFSKGLSFLRTEGSGWLFPPILRTEELCHFRSPKWLPEWYVITIKKNENLMDHIIGTAYGRYCWRRLENMEHKFSQKDIGLSFFKKEAVRKELNTVWLTKFLGLPSSDSRTLWWYSVNAGTDGVHVCSLQLERVHLS